MPTKKAASKSADDKEEAVASTPEPGTTRSGVDILPADREVLEGTIDERMAALLKDHQEMGVRE